MRYSSILKKCLECNDSQRNRYALRHVQLALKEEAQHSHNSRGYDENSLCEYLNTGQNDVDGMRFHKELFRPKLCILVCCIQNKDKWS